MLKLKTALTKENFWTPLESSNPDKLKQFYSWIDAYKKMNSWNELFNYGSPHYAKQGWHNPKFHELPEAMQFGIFIQFAAEMNPKWITEIDRSTMVNPAEIISNYFLAR